jgi:hypothetical protein
MMCAWARRWHWRGIRLLHGLEARVRRYRYPVVTRWLYRHYPPGYVRECPPWAMERSIPWNLTTRRLLARDGRTPRCCVRVTRPGGDGSGSGWWAHAGTAPRVLSAG